jgi:hypothetical protein
MAKTIREYKELNPGPTQAGDAKYDFHHGYLRLLPGSALSSLPVSLRDAVIAGSIVYEASPAGKGKRALPPAPMAMKTISSVFATRLITVVEGDGPLTRFLDDGWDPERVDPDVLSSRLHRLALVYPTS